MYSHKNDLRLVRVSEEEKGRKLIYYQVFISLLVVTLLDSCFQAFPNKHSWKCQGVFIEELRILQNHRAAGRKNQSQLLDARGGISRCC